MIRYNAPRPVQAADYLGATTASANAANQQYGNKVGQHNANMSGLYGIGSIAALKNGAAIKNALASALTSAPASTPGIGVGGTGAGLYSGSSPEVSSFMSNAFPGSAGAPSAGATPGIGAAGAGSPEAGTTAGMFTTGAGTGEAAGAGAAGTGAAAGTGTAAGTEAAAGTGAAAAGEGAAAEEGGTSWLASLMSMIGDAAAAA